MSNIIPTVNVSSLNLTVQAAIQAMFWPALAMAVIMPIAAAAGTVVAGKVVDKFGNEVNEKDKAN